MLALANVAVALVKAGQSEQAAAVARSIDDLQRRASTLVEMRQ